MTTSTSFAQMANNQSISLSSALRANTPPTKGQTTSRKFLTLSIFFLLSFFTTNLWGAEVLFHETFGNNSSSARAWNNSYSVKSGVSEVYTSVTYTMSNLKQSKNTGGCTQSGLLQTTKGTDASIIIGPLNVSNYEDLELSFMYKAGSVKETYKRSVQYKTSSNGTWNDLSVNGTQNASTCYEQVATLPYAAEGIETLYIKIIFNTSNTQATIDEVEVTGTKKVSCTEPTSVTVTPTNEFGWRYSTGETISLKATYEGGAGTPSYQWQKFIGDKWTNINGATAATYTKTNCTTSDGGSYRCVVSTGTNCSLESEGYFVRVFTLNGGYTTDGEWTAHKIVWTSENTGLVTLSLLVSETYYFKVTDNDGKWFGYGDASNYIIQPWQADCGTGNSNIRLFTGPAGDYKFTINIEHAQENSPYVNIKVDYPEVTHPVEGYAYINKWWDCYVHYWEGANNALTAWGSDPKINSDRYVNICGTDYWYFPVIETYTNFIAKNKASDPTNNNTTGDQSTTNHSGQNITHNGKAWVWQEFSTYSITFNGNGGTGSMTTVEGIACGGLATLTQNAFARTGYTFAGWATTADGAVAHADKATISNITSDITLYAKWTPNANTAYTVKHYKQQLDGTYSATPDDTDNLTGTTAASVTPAVKSYEGFTAPSAQTVTIAADGSTVVSYEYTRNSYTLTWELDGGTIKTDGTAAGEVKYGAALTAPTVTKTGYNFAGWSPEVAATMPAAKTTYTAQWKATYTVTFLNHGEEVEKVTVEAGNPVTLPTEELTSCDTENYPDFFGWTETPIAGVGTEAPADLITAGFTPERSMNLHAVFVDQLPQEGGWQVVTSTSELVAGKIYTIGSYGSPTTGTAMGTQNTNNRGTTSWTTGTPVELTLGGSTGAWTLYDPVEEGYLCAASSSENHLKIQTNLNNNGRWAITISSNKAKIQAQGDKTRNIIRYNSSSSIFSCYASGQGDIQLLTKAIGTQPSAYITSCCETPVPTNGTFDNVTGSGNAMSLTLNWEGSAERYHITGSNLAAEGIYTSETSYTVNNLTECEEYIFNVTAYPEDGCESAAIQISAQPFGDAKTVNYDYNGGSGSPESFTTSCDDDKREIILPVATRTGYTFEGWYDSEENKVGDAGATYDPATSPITLHAQWTETNYTLTHNGSNYTITENKTSIKSSETPFTLHYTCTGDYGLPATISITGGGKSWTVGTDYTWAVAADKQSATLVIKETVISADVTITINVATRYTVTFVHNDKGVFSGSETIEVLSSENTITLPTITDVSCGFYDTFEGWIVANEDYTESTSKPAGTIYKGGANYTVNGDCTLRALYSKCEGDATQVYRKVTATGEVTDGTYILVATTTGTSYVYSGNEGNAYGLCVSGLTTDDGDFSSTLPDGTDPISITVNDGKFAMYNANEEKYLTYTGSSNTLNTSDSEANVWKLTDGSQQINEKACPEGALTPSDNTRVLQYNTSQPRFACYTNNNSYPYVFLYKLIDKCTKYYSTNPSCEKPVGVHIVYNANAVDASMSCTEQNRTYKVENEVNKYPQLASQLQFCTNATREGYTLVGWNTQANGQGTTYNINQNYYNLPVSGELDGDKWITLNLYAMWKPCIKFNVGNATGGTGVPDAVVENGGCVLPTPTAEQLGTIPCGYEFYAWSETSVNATQTKPALLMPGDTYTGSALTLYAVYRWCEGNTGSDTYYFTFIVDGQTYCITRKHSTYDRFVVEEATSGLIFGIENDYLYYLDENGVKNYVYYEGSSTTVTTTTDYPNADTQKTTFVDAGDGTTIVQPAINNGNRTLQFTGTGNLSDSYDRAYYTTGGTNPTLVEVQSSICTYATNPTCYTNTILHFVTNGGTLNYPTDYNETNYQELAIGDDILLPTATFAGEWTFEGWKRGAPLESTTTKPYDPSFYSVTLNTTQFEVDALGDIYFYAVYSKTNDDKQFDPVNGGTYKLFAIGEDGTKTYMPVWTGTRGTPSGVTTCAETGDYTITPGTGTHAGQYQITCGEYTLGVVSSNTDLKEVEGTWWNISESTSNKGTWRITVAESTDDRALSCSFLVAKSFGNYAISNLNNPAQTIYRDMEIGECIYTEYTSTPENIPYITITGAPVKITSTNGERVYASTTVHIEAHNFTDERIIHLSATNGFGVDPVQVRTNGQGAYSGNVKVYYEPTTDGDGQTITTSVLTASQTGGTNAEKISQTFAAIQGRNMPANFVIAAKWDGHWYALPANCTSSLSSTEGLLIEVNDMENPTMATSAPASAKYGIRKVIPSRQTDYGQGIVFTERFAKDDKQFALYNGSDANIQVNAQYSNYAATNPDKYEWIPTTSDFNEYTVTNASTGRNLGLTSGSFGAYTAASNRVYLLPATFYEPAPVQVLKWKANSVIVMYTGAETTATTQVGDNAASDKQTLADQKLTHGIYELTTNQALTNNAGGVLKLNFGASTRVELEIPLIISGNVTASANAHDVVILENSKLTAAETKYSYKDVYVYGGAKLAIPDGAQLSVNNIILRAGGVATDGAGQNATYQYIYPQVELKGTLTSSVQNIRYEYVTDYDHWYHLVLPFDGSLASIHYPYEYYGNQVKLDNIGSWQIKRYDGATRATGNYDAWKNIEEDEPKATTVTAGKGYIYWGAPKKITANDVYDRPTWGIQRITMSVSAPAAKTAENADKTIAGLGSYKNVPNNSRKDNDQGWNLVGNPYMVNLTGLNSQSLQIGQLIHDTDASGNWTGKWHWDNTSEQTGLRYVTIPSDHFETYEAELMTWFTESNPMIAGRSFFVQIAGAATDLVFDVTKKASLMPALLAENNDKPVDIETGIILSNETLQDEMNFWIKDGKTNDYEYNADYPKTPNNNHFNIYGVHTNGDLSWVATSPEYAAQSMPIGYQVPAAGTFTLSVSETYYSENLQALFVTDHEASPEVTTNLVDEDYTFYVNQAETNNTRFTVSIILKPEKENTPTGVDNINTKANQPIKFLYQDKIYILRNGMIYDTTGKQVITINK